MSRVAGFAVAAALAVAVLAGCGGGEDDPPASGAGTGTGTTPAKPGARGEGERGSGLRGLPPPNASDERVIRGWNAALGAEDYGRAADHFARPSTVEQVAEVKLPDRRAAIAFNRSLPCKSKVTDLEAEAGATVAAFDLEPGPGGGQACAGDASVRFVIERGRIKEWRQLRGPQGPSGDVVRRGAGGPGARHG